MLGLAITYLLNRQILYIYVHAGVFGSIVKLTKMWYIMEKQIAQSAPIFALCLALLDRSEEALDANIYHQASI